MSAVRRCQHLLQPQQASNCSAKVQSQNGARHNEKGMSCRVACFLKHFLGHLFSARGFRFGDAHRSPPPHLCRYTHWCRPRVQAQFPWPSGTQSHGNHLAIHGPGRSAGLSLVESTSQPMLLQPSDSEELDITMNQSSSSSPHMTGLSRQSNIHFRSRYFCRHSRKKSTAGRGSGTRLVRSTHIGGHSSGWSGQLPLLSSW